MSGRRRWIRAVLPAAVLLALIAVTLIAHAAEQPDPGAPSFLSPVSGAGDGADRLAAELTARGVAVDRRTSTPAAVAAAVGGTDATLFVTTPQFVHPDYLEQFPIIPPSTRIVLVAPTAEVLDEIGLPVSPAGPRWTAAAPQPGCAEPFATAPAAVLRWTFTTSGEERFRCYADGLVELDRGGPAMTLVGAPDPFRNDRRTEHGNAEFAAALLARSSRVVWLDLHEREQPPPAADANTEPVPDVNEDFGEDEGRPDEDDESSSGGEENPRRPPGEPAEEPQAQQNPLAAAFPPAFWATVLVLALALIALALAAARRLGTPVAEPLPARVRAAETVRGLGGLYRRARARDASLGTVQAAATSRLAAHFGLPPDCTPDAVAERVAAHTGQPAGELRRLLGGGPVATDEDLTARAVAVQQLVRNVIDEGTT